jgi:hypothetical protein
VKLQSREQQTDSTEDEEEMAVLDVLVFEKRNWVPVGGGLLGDAKQVLATVDECDPVLGLEMDA